MLRGITEEKSLASSMKRCKDVSRRRKPPPSAKVGARSSAGCPHWILCERAAIACTEVTRYIFGVLLVDKLDKVDHNRGDNHPATGSKPPIVSLQSFRPCVQGLSSNEGLSTYSYRSATMGSTCLARRAGT